MLHYLGGGRKKKKKRGEEQCFCLPFRAFAVAGSFFFSPIVVKSGVAAAGDFARKMHLPEILLHGNKAREGDGGGRAGREKFMNRTVGSWLETAPPTETFVTSTGVVVSVVRLDFAASFLFYCCSAKGEKKKKKRGAGEERRCVAEHLPSFSCKWLCAAF